MKQQMISSKASAVDLSAMAWRRLATEETRDWLLVVDDDQLAGRTVARRAARITACHTRLARTLHQAECWLSTLPSPAAVVSDFDLQGDENGVLLVQRLMERGIRCPVALFTGSPQAALLALEEAALTRCCVVLGKAGDEASLHRWLGSLRVPRETLTRRAD